MIFQKITSMSFCFVQLRYPSWTYGILFNKLAKLYNLCLLVLLRLDLELFRNLFYDKQQVILKPLNLLPFKFRLLLSFSLFSHIIICSEIICNIKNNLLINENACKTIRVMIQEIFSLSRFVTNNDK